MTSRHALVVGASGLAGWGVANVLLDQYPSPGAFSTVTALVNRPMTVEESYWPHHSGGPKLNLVSGVDLTKGSAAEFTTLINEKVSNFSTVTHVFYFGKQIAARKLPKHTDAFQKSIQGGREREQGQSRHGAARARSAQQQLSRLGVLRLSNWAQSDYSLHSYCRPLKDYKANTLRHQAYGAHIPQKILSVPLKEEDAKVEDGAADTTRKLPSIH